MNGRQSPVLAAVLWVGMLLAVIGGLHVAGSGTLGAPPVTSTGGWSRWLAHTDPIVVAFAVIRLVALGAAWYTLTVTVLGAAARLVGSGVLIAAADRITLPVLRRLLAVSLSAGMVGGSAGALAGDGAAGAAAQTTTTVAVVGADQPGPRTTIVMHRLSEPGAPGGTAGTAEPATTSSTVPPVDRSADPSATTSPSTASGATILPVGQPPRPGTSLPGVARVGEGVPGEWRVAPGQCFWSIAHDVLASTWGRTPSDGEIVPYWQRLIEANRGALADRDNPDLIFPGQVFTVPAP